MSDQEIVEKLARVWRSVADLGATFTETEWKTPTDCPHWSVQDNVSHFMLLAPPRPVRQKRLGQQRSQRYPPPRQAGLAIRQSHN